YDGDLDQDNDYSYGIDDEYEQADTADVQQAQDSSESGTSAASQVFVAHVQSAEDEDVRSGRKRGAVWRCFEKLGQQPHAPVKCVFCNTSIGAGFPKRNMLPHVLKCSMLPPFEKHLQRKAYHLPDEALPDPEMRPPSEPGRQVAREAARTAEQAASTTRPVTQEAFELLLARVFFLSSLPFLLIEAPDLVMLFARIAPHLTLPARAKLAGLLLERVAEQVRSAVIDKIRLQGVVSIVTDYWTNCNGTSVINFMVVAGGMKSFLWEAFDMGPAKHTAAYLATVLERIIKEIQTQTGAAITGVLTDNASNMTAAWELLEDKLFIFGGGCAAHVLNLVIEGLFSEVAFVVDVKEKRLQNYWNGTGSRKASRAISSFTAIDDTAWCKAARTGDSSKYTVHGCLKSVLLNRRVLDDLFCAARHKSLRDSFTTADLEHAVALIDPIIEALGVLESDLAWPSRVYKRFRWLMEGYSDEPLSLPGSEANSPPHHIFGELPCMTCSNDGAGGRGRGRGRGRGNGRGRSWTRGQSISAELRGSRVAADRGSCSVQSTGPTDAISIALLLDPNTGTKQYIDGDEAEIIKERATTLRELTWTQLNGYLYNFASEKKRWTRETRAQYAGVNPRHWWSIHAQENVMYQKLSLLAGIVFAIPTSSAASERAFSIIHNKKRNCISVKKVGMLASIYINGGILDDDTLDLSSLYMKPMEWIL
ncbi:hAT family C-terminal dimerization region, partial [Phytophthora infestans]